MPHADSTEPVVGTSRFSYSETVLRLGIEIAKAGATTFCKLDQSGTAKAAGCTLRPTTLFIFGNTKADAELMQATPLAALDLPLKLLVWEEEAAARVAYLPARGIAERYGVATMDSLIDAMDALLQHLLACMAGEHGGVGR
jgi:uncharacterized protein (DUF302 family)